VKRDFPRLFILAYHGALGMRPLLSCAILGVLAAPLGCAQSGCAQIEGIAPVSGTTADDQAENCVDAINALRADKMQPPVSRWLDHEACATKAAKGVAETGTVLDCGATWASCGPDLGGVDDVTHVCVTDFRAVLTMRFDKVACGFFATSDQTTVMMLFNP